MTQMMAKFIVVLLSLCLGVTSVFAQSGPDAFVGRRLEDALRVLQMRGLRVVFSSEMVTADMRIASEPRAKSGRKQLAELLEPHGLAAENGPGGVIQVVRQKQPKAERPRGPVAPAPQRKADADHSDVLSAGTVYRERVTVTASPPGPRDVTGNSPRRLESGELQAFGGHVADDPLRIVQALPGVAGGDDFRSEYSVRGSPYHHAGMVVDGVIAPWLQHAAVGRGDTGTMSMLPSDMVQEATLHVGAYARRDGGQIGPQLNLALREGSRLARRYRMGVSGTTATLTAEGPLGAAARGSWIVGLRKSHVEWPVGRDDHQITVFGFGDLQSKFVYDVRPGQQVSVSLVAGVSNIERDDPNLVALADGVNRATMATVAWRSIVGSRTVVTQRMSSLVHEYLNGDQATGPANRGTNRAGAYRFDVTRTLFRGVVEAGGQVRRVRGSGRGPEVIDASWSERSGHASFRRTLGAGVTLESGLRLADSTLVHHRALDRWLQAEWSPGSRWFLHGSTGVMHQFPALEHVRGWAGPVQLRPERATYVDLGIGQRLSSSVRWDATLFARRERDVLRRPEAHLRMVDGIFADKGVGDRFENVLAGSARGMELTLERRRQTGLSGWVGYSYGVARHTDTTHHETFQADFDQRHAINVSASAALPWKTRVGLTFRGGTNFPIPGYLVARGSQLFPGDERNRVRLPAYARLDLRAERAFDHRGLHFTLFAETLNVLNRTNVGLADGVIMRDTGEAIGFTERLFPRLMSAGLRFEF